MSGSCLPDDLWRRILEIGVETNSLIYRDLCCLAISCRRLRRLSEDDHLWSLLLSGELFSPLPTCSSSSSLPSKTLFKIRFEREREKKIAAHRRAVLRKESQVSEHSRRISELEIRLAEESDKLRGSLLELSSLRSVRQASVALNVWQPEVVRGRHKQMVEQNVVSIESRLRAMEMEIRLCKQQISGFVAARDYEKRRLDVAKEELNSMNYHPLQPNLLMTSVEDERESKNTAKRLKRCQTSRRDKGKKTIAEQ